MKRYRVLVTGTDNLGWNFIQNIVTVANMGGQITMDVTPRLTFPHHVMMIVDSEKELISVPGIKYTPILKTYKLEELEDMEWDSFRSIMREAGIIGKERKVMLEKYSEFLKTLD